MTIFWPTRALTSGEKDLKREITIAARERLGNEHLVTLLRAELFNLGFENDTSLILRKILYSGTHSGDVISADDFNGLKRELAYITEMSLPRGSTALLSFLAKMQNLVAVAEEQGNPIVFV